MVPSGVWQPGDPAPAWQSGWIVVHSAHAHDLRIHGLFHNEATMWRDLEPVRLGEPGAAVYAAVPVTAAQAERFAHPRGDLSPFLDLVRHARECAGGIVRLMLVSPGPEPLWLGDPLPF